ncbi:M16 family metallopeptidase [Amycolatopsis suaedae]|uniref:Insulinase family protein n=1 Tax=Amycolatopsis suaedae TaxID=2510978 RepID=A0A4Q7J5V6_9PSEU|nr:insulinase family protein [Amycolatopsis suaedae]RZQ62981.1 insulinase family protein [Amycolatopsis suaedae]
MTSLSTLPNGVRVVVDQRPDAAVCAIAVTVGAGASSDPRGGSGLAHLVEHLMFRRSPVSAGHLEQVRAVGGLCNATTGHDTTVYHSLVPAGETTAILRAEGRRFAPTAVTDSAVEAERGVVLAEIDEARGTSASGASWYAVAPALLGRTAAALAPHGDPDQLMTLRGDDCTGFVDRHYGADNLVVSVVGDAGTADVVALVERFFGGLRPCGASEAGPASGAHGPAPDPVPAEDGRLRAAVGFPVPDPELDRAAYLAHVLLARVLSTHHFPALSAGRAELARATMSVGPGGRWLRRRRADLALAELTASRGDVGDLAGLLLLTLDHVRRHGIDDRARMRAVRRLQLEQHHLVDDPLRHAIGLGRAEALGFGHRSWTGLSAELAGLPPQAAREAAERLLAGPRTVLPVDPGGSR